MGTVRIGCSGWVYDHWRGPVYPDGHHLGEEAQRARPDGGRADRWDGGDREEGTRRHSRLSIEVEGESDLSAKGNIVDHEYEIERDGEKVAEVSIALAPRSAPVGTTP